METPFPANKAPDSGAFRPPSRSDEREAGPEPPRTRKAASAELFRHPAFSAAFAGGFLWCLFYLLMSTGWSLDDELSHYLRSRSVWENPALIFDAWTRIGRNLFHVVPAAIGLTAARLWTLVFAALAVWLTTLLALRLGVRRAWLVPLAMWFQPWFVELSWGVLTQTPFLLALLGGIWFLTTGRPAWSGLCFGLLPLIRHEGIALLGLWALAVTVDLLRHGRWLPWVGAGLASALPLAAYNLAAWWCLGELPLRIYFDAKPTEIYGSGPLWHFLAVSLVPAGPATVVLTAVGLPRGLRNRRACWPLVFYPAYFALHSVIFWKGLFASGGYYHFLMPMAPGLAVAAAWGLETLLDRGWRKTAAVLGTGLVLQGMVLLHVLSMQVWAGGSPRLGLAPEPIHHALREALDWQAAHRPNARPVICRHVYAAFVRDWVETEARRALAGVTAAGLPPGALVIWENKYSDLSGLPLRDFLDAKAGWVERAAFGEGTVRIFEKTTVPPRD